MPVPEAVVVMMMLLRLLLLLGLNIKNVKKSVASERLRLPSNINDAMMGLPVTSCCSAVLYASRRSVQYFPERQDIFFYVFFIFSSGLMSLRRAR